MGLAIRGSRRRIRPLPTTTPAPAVAASLQMFTEPSGGVDDEPLTQQPVIQVLDQYGAPFPQAGIEVVASLASGTGALVGDVDVLTDANGRATFVTLEINGTGNHSLDFDSTGLTGTTSAVFDVAAPPPAGDVMTMQLWRWDDDSGNIKVSDGLGLKPGQLSDSGLSQVRVYVDYGAGMVEQAVALNPAYGRHPDGSYRSLGIQFLANVPDASVYLGEVRLNAGARGTVDIAWEDVAFDNASPLVANMWNKVAFQSNDPVHMCESFVGLVHLQPEADDTAVTTIFDTDVTTGNGFGGWVHGMHNETSLGYSGAAHREFNNQLTVHTEAAAGQPQITFINNTGAPIILAAYRYWCFDHTPGSRGTAKRYQCKASYGGVGYGSRTVANGATVNFEMNSNFTTPIAAGTPVWCMGGSLGQATYEHVHGLFCAYIRSANRTIWQYAKRRLMDQFDGDYAYYNCSTDSANYAETTGQDLSLYQSRPAGSHGLPAEQHSGVFFGWAVGHLMTAWRQPWLHLCLVSSWNWGSNTYSTHKTAITRSSGAMRRGSQLYAGSLVVAYLVEATANVPGTYGPGRNQGTTNLFGTQLPMILQAWDEDRYTGYTDPRSGQSGFADGMVGLYQGNTAGCGGSAHAPNLIAGHTPFFQLFTQARTAIAYYTLIYPDPNIPVDLKTNADIIIACADRDGVGGAVQPADKYAYWPYCLEPPGASGSTATYWMGFYAELFGFCYAHETDPTKKETYRQWAMRALDRDQYASFSPKTLKAFGEYFGGHQFSAIYYLDGGAIRGFTGVHPTVITEPPAHSI